jgi:hypothetical protein
MGHVQKQDRSRGTNDREEECVSETDRGGALDGGGRHAMVRKQNRTTRTPTYMMIRIATHLEGRNGLDLSDCSSRNCDRKDDHSHDSVPWTTPFDSNTLAGELEVLEMLGRLEWLGLPDVRRENVPPFLWPNILPRCIRLATLSIRGDYKARSGLEEAQALPHNTVCWLAHAIASYASKTVVTSSICSSRN